VACGGVQEIDPLACALSPLLRQDIHIRGLAFNYGDGDGAAQWRVVMARRGTARAITC
jgi:hypothetical protein